MLPQPPSNPWQRMWLHPRVTIRAVVSRNKRQTILLLLALSGISRALNGASMKNAGDQQDLFTVLSVAVLTGMLSGLFTAYLIAPVLRWLGKCLGGQATTSQVRAALAWGSLPIAASLVLLLPELALFGEEFFKTATPRIDQNEFLHTLLLVFGLVEVTLGIWAVVLIVVAIAEVQVFAVWKSLLSFVLLILMFFVLLFVYYLFPAA